MAIRNRKTVNLATQIFIILAVSSLSIARKHKLKLHNEVRDMIDITTFGFFRDGMLAIDIHLSCEKSLIEVIQKRETENKEYSIGFTLDKSSSDGSASYMEDHAEPCVLTNGHDQSREIRDNDSVSVVFLRFNFTENKVHIDRVGKSLKQLSILPMPANNISIVSHKTCVEAKNLEALGKLRKKRSLEDPNLPPGNINQEGPIDKLANINENNPSDDEDNNELGNPSDPNSPDNVAKLSPKFKPATRTDIEDALNGGVGNDNEVGLRGAMGNGGADEGAVNDGEQGLDGAAGAPDNDPAPVEEGEIAGGNQGDNGEGIVPVEVNYLPKTDKGEDTGAKGEDTGAKGEDTGAKGEDTGAKEETDGDGAKKQEGGGAGAQGAEVLRTTLKMFNSTEGTRVMYNISYVVCIGEKKEEGLYNLYFHHCGTGGGNINLTVGIVEMNNKNYLSAGDIPLPPLFITMSMVFFTSAVYWMVYLRKKREDVFKIHYLMLLLIYLKALSLLFHALDYHYIGIDGSPMEAFAILFYITYLTKGALLFIVIALVGSGWAFVKPILSDKDKKIFIVVIPLQVLANVAYIITDTSEEGESQYITWKAVFVLVDILCCGAILYPVIWSIRHLQEAATTDGKGKLIRTKLPIFCRYWFIVVCYIYFTRIIVYLLKVTVPFQYMWLDELFYEMATYIFFAITAYKFRPGSDNPYLLIPDEDEDDIEMEIVTKTGLTESVVRSQSGNSTSAVQRELNHSA